MREKWGRAHLPQYPERLQSLSGSLHVADVFFYVVAERQRMEQIYFLLFLLGAHHRRSCPGEMRSAAV